MTIEKIIEILNPLDEITNDKMLFRDYREISKESPEVYKDRDTEYHQLLWFDSKTNTAVNFWLYEKKFKIELRKNDNTIISWSKPIESLDSSTLRYFIMGVEIHFDYLNKIGEFRFGTPPKDFIRNERLNEILDK